MGWRHLAKPSPLRHRSARPSNSTTLSNGDIAILQWRIALMLSTIITSQIAGLSGGNAMTAFLKEVVLSCSLELKK